MEGRVPCCSFVMCFIALDKNCDINDDADDDGAGGQETAKKRISPIEETMKIFQHVYIAQSAEVLGLSLSNTTTGV